MRNSVNKKHINPTNYCSKGQVSERSRMSNRDLQGFLSKSNSKSHNPNRHKSHYNVLNQTMQVAVLNHEDLANSSLDIEEVGTMLLSRQNLASTQGGNQNCYSPKTLRGYNATSEIGNILTEDGNLDLTRPNSKVNLIDLDGEADDEPKFYVGPALPNGSAEFFRPSDYSQRMFQMNLSSRIGTIKVKDFFENNSIRSSLAYQTTARGYDSTD